MTDAHSKSEAVLSALPGMGLRPVPSTALVLSAAACVFACMPLHAGLCEEARTVRSARYSLQWEGPEAEAREMSLVLEAAWPQFKAFFGAEPRIGRGEALEARFYGSRELWIAGIESDGDKAPPAGGGYYSPHSRTVYLYRQPTRYYTRSLLIHEACHQFHFLSRTGNAPPSTAWYTEGVVEHLAMHTWDGRTLRLGVTAMSLEDYAASALARLESAGGALAEMARGGLDRPLGAMFVRYLLEGENGRYRKAFDLAAREFDRGGKPGRNDFRNFFGDPAAVSPRFLSWLRASQEPMAQVFNEWEMRAPGTYMGEAKGVYSATRIKAPASSIEAILERPASDRWRAGLLLDFKDAADFTIGIVDASGAVTVQNLAGGVWRTLASARRADDAPRDLVALSARRSGGQVEFAVDGRVAGSAPASSRVLGLAVHDCAAVFRDVKWDPDPDGNPPGQGKAPAGGGGRK